MGEALKSLMCFRCGRPFDPDNGQWLSNQSFVKDDRDRGCFCRPCVDERAQWGTTTIITGRE